MRWILGISVVLCLLLGVVLAIWLGRDVETSPTSTSRLNKAWADEMPPDIKRLCSSCHHLPPPDCEPRSLWAKKIEQMYGVIESDRPWPKTELPKIDRVKAFYEARAPEVLQVGISEADLPARGFPLRPHTFKLEGVPPAPAVSFVEFVQLFDGENHQFSQSSVDDDMTPGSSVRFTSAE